MFSIYSMASESFGADFVVVAVAPLISSLCVLFSGLGGAEVWRMDSNVEIRWFALGCVTPLNSMTFLFSCFNLFALFCLLEFFWRVSLFFGSILCGIFDAPFGPQKSQNFFWYIKFPIIRFLKF